MKILFELVVWCVVAYLAMFFVGEGVKYRLRNPLPELAPASEPMLQVPIHRQQNVEFIL